MSTEIALTTTDPRDRKTYYLRTTPFRRVIIPFAQALLILAADWRTEGVENIPLEGPVVLASNHLTNMDVFFLQFSLTRPIYFMGKEELFRNPLMDWMLRQLGAFPVYRGAHDEWAINYAQNVLEQGQVLGIFPEGTRNRGQGLRPAKTGMARLAQAVNCPILPVAIHGTQYLFNTLPQRAAIRLRFGAPLYPEPGESITEMTERVMFAMADMLPPESRGAYRRQRADG